MSTLREFVKALRTACGEGVACVRVEGTVWGEPTPDRVTDPIPGVPADGPHVVVASPSWVVPEKRRRK